MCLQRELGKASTDDNDNAGQTSTDDTDKLGKTSTDGSSVDAEAMASSSDMTMQLSQGGNV
jgi:hypothetical protein